MSRRVVANTVATVIACGVGLFAMWASATYLRHPNNVFDWSVLVFSGLMTGTFVFFIAWGHFQREPGKAGTGTAAPPK